MTTCTTSATPTSTPPVAAPAARVATALSALREIWPRGAGCEHIHAARAFTELEAAQADLAKKASSPLAQTTLATLRAIAAVSDNACENNNVTAFNMRAHARKALGIPAEGEVREPVKPCCAARKPEMPTAFTGSPFRSAEEQAASAAAFKRFLVGGCMEKDFTNTVYSCAMLELGFIAHCDRKQFYSTYFRTWEGVETFTEGIGAAYQTRNYGAAHHQELKAALFCLATQHGVRPSGA